MRSPHAASAARARRRVRLVVGYRRARPMGPVGVHALLLVVSVVFAVTVIAPVLAWLAVPAWVAGWLWTSVSGSRGDIKLAFVRFVCGSVMGGLSVHDCSGIVMAIAMGSS